VPLGTTATPVAGCSLVSGTYPFATITQPSEPVAMGTVTVAYGLVKTVARDRADGERRQVDGGARGLGGRRARRRHRRRQGG
jgi:hypothetical protein